MFSLKKQIRILYLRNILCNLSITGAWVAILSARGFSLVQIGFAETIFHITSLICEIPSGMLADLYGRKKMLVISSLMGIIGDLLMFLSRDFLLISAAMVLFAMSYNFASGSGEALAYDSMKRENAQGRYEKFTSDQSVIYRIANGISTLMAGLALYLGYQKAYLISAGMGLITMLITLKLTEIKGVTDGRDGEETEYRRHPKILKQIGGHFAASLKFLVHHVKAAEIMFLNSFVGAVDILLLFFLQSKLGMAGISKWALGIALFIMELGGIAGARLILRAKKVRYAVIFLICTAGVFIGILLEHTAVVWLMAAGGFISAMSDDAIQIRTEARLQDMFPSEQRATLISVSSFTFSVVMIVLSPLAGYFFSVW